MSMYSLLLPFAANPPPSLSPPSLPRSLSLSLDALASCAEGCGHTLPPGGHKCHTPHPCFRHCLFFTMDARDILGIDASAGGSAPRPRASKPSIKKPEGMSREVFALLLQDIKEGRADASMLVPTPAAKDQFKERKTRVVGWESRKFANAARDDGLMLRHWSKLSEKSSSYAFARFDKKVKVLEYTDEEYDRCLTHPAWDRNESALLFDLCRRFDLRWPVIHDRFPEGRTMEQLKERYYDMCRALLALRSEKLENNEHPLANYRFDAKHERERKLEFQRLYDRSDDEVRNEIRALEQARALEAKMKAQKKVTVKPGGRAAGLAALRASLSQFGMSGSASDLAVSDLPSLAGLMDAPRKHRTSEVWLRSKDLSSKRPASEKLATQFEMRMGMCHMPVRPLPTEVNVSLYNQNRAHVVLLVELEAKIEKLESERAQILNPQLSAAPAAPSHHAYGAAAGGGGGGGAGQKRAREDTHASAGHKRSHH